MKKVLVVAGIVTTMVAGLAAMASATTVDSAWLVYLKASTPGGSGYMSTMNIGTTASAIDGYKIGEDLKLSSNPGNAAELISIGSAGDATARVYQDRRAALPATNGASIEWNLRCQVGSSYPDANVLVKVWQPSGTYNLDASDMIVSLIVGDKTYSITPNSATSEANPLFSFTLPAGTTDFKLVASTVPEPGSMFAMLSGLVGLAGFGIRRRK